MIVSAVVVDTLTALAAVVQAFVKFVTSTDPRPVARSYPGPAFQASALVLLGFTITPKPLVPVLLQFGEPALQATEIVLLVAWVEMSLNTQAGFDGVLGFVLLLESQLIF